MFVSLIAWFAGGKELQGNSKKIIRQMFNFEITLFIACIVLVLIPLVGLLLCLVFGITNIVFAIKSFITSGKGEAFKAPAFEFIK